jgi:NTP pyrophosphatase (non-canonical NTP hydrolase)
MKSIKELSEEINKTNHEKGFWDAGLEGKVPEKLMLIVSELSEALEADRKNRHVSPRVYLQIPEEGEDFISFFETYIKDRYEDELADVAIRLFDLAEEQGTDLYQHIRLKMRYNKTRPHMHGKRY